MLRKNQVVQNAITAILAVCESKGRGDILSHEEIEASTGMTRYDGSWTYAITRLKKRLEADRGITIWSERCIGYRLLPLVDQFGMAPMKRVVFGMRQVKKGLSHVEAPVSDAIPHKLREKRAFVRERLRAQKSALHGETIRQGIFDKRQAGAPRVPFAAQSIPARERELAASTT